MKAKEKFEEWFNNNWTNRKENREFCERYSDSKEGYYELHSDEFFECFPDSMKWGVYLEFFDSEGIEIYIHCSNDVTIWSKGDEVYSSTRILTRQQAQTEALKKAFEILEERL